MFLWIGNLKNRKSNHQDIVAFDAYWKEMEWVSQAEIWYVNQDG